MQKQSAEVIAGNYVIRYMFGCIGTAVVLPAIEHIGVGYFSTVSAALMVFAASMTWMVTLRAKPAMEKSLPQGEKAV